MNKIKLIMIASLLILSGCSTKVEENLTVESTNQEDTNLENDLTIITLTYPTKDYLSEVGESILYNDDDEIIITSSGTYEFQGDYLNSTITVNVNKDVDDGTVYLILNNVNIETKNGTPINIVEAKDVVIIVEGENSITQSEVTTTDTDFPSAALYSKADTVITGDGTLNVSTSYQDGINSRDDLIIEDVSINITANEDGIVGKDLLAISNANITIDAEKDGLKSTNTEDLTIGNIIIESGYFNITAANDAISSDNILQIDGGEFNLSSGDGYIEVIKTPSSGPVGGGTQTGIMQPGMEMDGELDPNAERPKMDREFDPNSTIEGYTDDELPDNTFEESMKALKALNSLVINGGTFNISAYEDAVHSDGVLIINDGKFIINTGDDGFTSLNTIINSGEIVIENCFEGVEGNNININGGNIYINTEDDGINGNDALGGIIIANGDIEVVFGAGGDGIDANGFFTQTGGDIAISAPEGADQMNAYLDVDGVVTMTGGTIFDENGNEIEASIGHSTPNQMGGNRPNNN